MKYLIKPIMLLLSLPLALLVLLCLCLGWLTLHCWGCKDEGFMETDSIKTIAYAIWHFGAKRK